MGFLTSTRSFNTIEVDAGRRVARKTSQDGAALAKEIGWYLDLPDDLDGIGPRIIDYDLDPASAFLEMEAYDAPSLSEVFLNDRIEPQDWLAILEELERLMARMGAHTGPELTEPRRVAALSEMYLAKTAERLRQVPEGHLLQAFREQELTVNDAPTFGIAEVLEILPLLLPRARLLEPREFSIIHGDLCLSNVLLDVATGRLRVVDPRGDFGGLELYGDPLYDLAKLNHSFEGGYDLLLTGQFDFSCHGTTVAIATRRTPKQAMIRDLFVDWSHDRWTVEEIEQVRLVESLLFLSMVPLHPDRPDSQVAFLARGLELFTKAAASLGLEPST